MALQAMQTGRDALHAVTGHQAFKTGKSLGDAAIDRAVDTVTADTDADDRFTVLDEKGHVVEETTPDEFNKRGLSAAGIMRTVRVIGGAMIGLAVLVVVLDQVFTINSISSSSGPFSGVIDSLEGTGVAALSLLVIGLLVAAANRVMGFFGGGGF